MNRQRGMLTTGKELKEIGKLVEKRARVGDRYIHD